MIGMYFNPGCEVFAEMLNSFIYVDKTGLLKYTNMLLGTRDKQIASSRPRRFGKSVAAAMLVAYYSKGCDSSFLFENLEIAKDPSFKRHLNRYDVIFFDMQMMKSDAMDERKTVTGYVQKEIIREIAKEYPGIIT